jgi:hypothetical protein
MANDSDNQSLRDHLLSLLRGGNAHLTFEDFVRDFPPELCDRDVEGVPYTAWQILEHMRIAQWDILEFSRSAAHQSPDFPKGYWPKPIERGNTELWTETIGKFQADLKEMEELVNDPATDLFAKIPHGNGQTILREALVLADHNAYHLGVLAVMSRILSGG